MVIAIAQSSRGPRGGAKRRRPTIRLPQLKPRACFAGLVLLIVTCLFFYQQQILQRGVASLFLVQETTIPVEYIFGCLTVQCIQRVAAGLARAFPLRHDKSTWCHSAPQKERFMGILLTKVPKGASSTAAGVALRIAQRHGCANLHWRHRLASEYGTGAAGGATSAYDPRQSFLFTTIRDPAARAISTLFFHVVSRTTNSQVATSDAFLLRELQTSTQSHYGAVSKGQGGFQLRYTSLQSIGEDSAWRADSPEVVIDAAAVVENVRQVVDTYGFLLVPERMDESLVALALILGIDVGDVLVTASKVAGSRYHLLHSRKNEFQCVPTVKSFVSDAVQTFFASDQWRAMNYGDYLLHEVAQQSLDLTVQQLGRDRFQVALARYRHLRSLEQEQCASSVAFPCSDDGVPQTEIAARNCYLRFYDFGCGYPCIDALADNSTASIGGNVAT